MEEELQTEGRNKKRVPAETETLSIHLTTIPITNLRKSWKDANFLNLFSSHLSDERHLPEKEILLPQLLNMLQVN